MAKKRLDIILDILKEQGYVTVKYLTEQLHYSTATINRDLNDLQKQKLIRRHYGGAELIERKGTPLIFRYHKMRPVKNLIGKKAAEFINDGDVIFIDGSTTGQCIGQYITEKNDLTVITNNITLASYLSEHGIKSICLGGKIVEIPSMTGGSETDENAAKYHADKAFFATSGITDDGVISCGSTYNVLHRIMIKNSDKVFYLGDHQKVNIYLNHIVCDLSSIDYIICDYKFSDEIKEKYSNTTFVEIETPKTQS